MPPAIHVVELGPAQRKKPIRSPGSAWLCLTLLLVGACGSSAATPPPVDAAEAPMVDSQVPVDSAPPVDAACESESLQALCSVAGYTCGDAMFTDRCGIQVSGSCGTCVNGTCGGDDGEHVCTPATWSIVEWPSLQQSVILAMASAPGSSTVWAGGGVFGAGELWQIEDFSIAILRTGSTIHGVHAAGPDVWAVGNRGSVLHGSDGEFTPVPSAPLQGLTLNAVWGFGPSDVWVTAANGVNSVAHWDGRSWDQGMLPSTDAVPGCTGLWASAPDDLWTVCKGGEIFHWDGADWAKVASTTTQDLHGIFGFAANNIWAVGNSNTLLHWNGTAWSSQRAPSGGALQGIWGSAPNDVYAVGGTGLGNGRVIHFDGVAWSAVLLAPRSTNLDRIAGAQGRVFATGIPALLVTYP